MVAFSIEIIDSVLSFTIPLRKEIAKDSNVISRLIDLLSANQTITYNDLCGAADTETFCFESLSYIEIPLPKFPKVLVGINKINETVRKILSIDIPTSLEAIVIVPLFAVFVICLIQLFLFIRETRLHLNQLHKGYLFLFFISEFYHQLFNLLDT